MSVRIEDDSVFIAMLGTRFDPDVAKRFGVTTETVRKTRVKLGIKAFVAQHVDLARLDSLLGKDTDENVASVVGTQSRVVRARRHLLQVPSFAESRARGDAATSKPILSFTYTTVAEGPARHRVTDPRVWHGVVNGNPASSWYLRGYCLDCHELRDFDLLSVRWRLP